MEILQDGVVPSLMSLRHDADSVIRSEALKGLNVYFHWRGVGKIQTARNYLRDRRCSRDRGWNSQNNAVEARPFLEMLFAGKPEELYILIWTLPE